MKTFNLLIVDDDDIIRKNLVNYLTNYHKIDYNLVVNSACNSKEALQIIDKEPFDMVLADINMPDQSGFELIEAVKRHFPKIKTALITAYKVEDYLKLAKEKGVSNIIVKTSPFNFNEFSASINAMILPEKYLFDLNNYLHCPTNINEIIVSNTNQISQIQSSLRSQMDKLNIPNKELLTIAFLEAVTNAIYYSSVTKDGLKKHSRGDHIENLESNEQVLVKYGNDEEKFGLSVMDNGGKLSKNEILYWLERNFSGSGILDPHGRGFYLMHTISDRLIINIKPNVKTEIILLVYLNEKYNGHKPIYINEI